MLWYFTVVACKAFGRCVCVGCRMFRAAFVTPVLKLHTNAELFELNMFVPGCCLSLSECFCKAPYRKTMLNLYEVAFKRAYYCSILSKPKTQSLHNANHLVILVGSYCQASRSSKRLCSHMPSKLRLWFSLIQLCTVAAFAQNILSRSIAWMSEG